MSNGAAYMARFYRAEDSAAHLVDSAPGRWSGNPFWRCRRCASPARMLGILWCARCADAVIAERSAEPAEAARITAAVRLAADVQTRLPRADAPALRRDYAELVTACRVVARLDDSAEAVRVAIIALFDRMAAVLPAHPIAVATLLPVTGEVLARHVDRYVRARGAHRPIVVVGWPEGGMRHVVDGRHRTTAARLGGWPTVPAVFAAHRDPPPHPSGYVWLRPPAAGGESALYGRFRRESGRVPT